MPTQTDCPCRPNATRAPEQFLSLTHCSQTHVLPLPCLSASPRQPLCKYTVTSQTCQIKITRAVMSYYIYSYSSKTCYSGATINVGGGVGGGGVREGRGRDGGVEGLYGLHQGWEGDARCTLVLRCLQEMFRCFVQGRRVQLKIDNESTTQLLSGIS